jgi:predicted kinase
MPASPAPALHLPRGLPASGKTTLARRLAAQGAAHVALDAHRRRVWPDCPPSWDPYSGRGLAVQAAFEAEVAGWLAAGRDVVADRTNLNGEGLRRLEALGGRLVIHDLRHVRLADCLARDAARPPADRVGEDGIRALHRRWL